jgi:hypothetical protein
MFLFKYHFLLHILRFLFLFSDNIMADVASKQQTTALFLSTIVICTTHRTDKKLTNLMGKLCCAREHSLLNFNCCPSVHVDNHTIITPTKCTLLLLKAQDITICTLCLLFCPNMFQPAWVIFRGLNASAWLKLLLITIY